MEAAIGGPRLLLNNTIVVVGGAQRDRQGMEPAQCPDALPVPPLHTAAYACQGSCNDFSCQMCHSRFLPNVTLKLRLRKFWGLMHEADRPWQRPLIIHLCCSLPSPTRKLYRRLKPSTLQHLIAQRCKVRVAGAVRLGRKGKDNHAGSENAPYINSGQGGNSLHQLRTTRRIGWRQAAQFTAAA
eukprot:scaffold32683_cov20-Tisochrysis_lutea.AAC.2